MTLGRGLLQGRADPTSPRPHPNPLPAGEGGNLPALPVSQPSGGLRKGLPWGELCVTLGRGLLQGRADPTSPRPSPSGRGGRPPRPTRFPTLGRVTQGSPVGRTLRNLGPRALAGSRRPHLPPPSPQPSPSGRGGRPPRPTRFPTLGRVTRRSPAEEGAGGDGRPQGAPLREGKTEGGAGWRAPMGFGG